MSETPGLADLEKSFFQFSPDLLCISNPDGHLKMLSPSWQQILGWSLPELMAKPWIEWLHPDDVVAWVDLQRRAGRGDRQQFDQRWHHRDGHYQALSWHVTWGEDGLLYGVARVGVARVAAREVTREIAREIAQEGGDRTLPSNALANALDPDTQATYRVLLQAIPDLIMRLNQEGTYLDFIPTDNFPVVKVSQEMRGKNIYEAMPLEVAQQRMQYIQAALRTGKIQIYEYEFQWEDTTRFEEARIAPLTSDEVLVIVRDIGDRQQAKALQHQEEQYQFLINNLREVVFQTNLQGDWSFLNPAWTTMTGFTVEESLGTPFINYIHPDDRQRNWELFEPLIARKKDYCRHSVRYLTKENQVRWIEVFAHLIFDQNGDILGTAGTLNDISDRRQAEIALQESERRFRLAVDHIPDVFVIYDAERRFHFVNEEGIRRSGLQEADMLGYRDEEIFPPEVTQSYLPLLLKTVASRTIQTGECLISWPNAPASVILVTYVPILDAAGEIDQILSIGHDITARKQSETALANLVAGTAAVTGHDFFPALVSHLASALDVRCAVVSEWGGDRLHTLAFWADHQLQPNVTYDPESLPCSLSLQQGLYCCTEQLQQQFPHQPILINFNIDSYLGIALHNNQGQLIGNLCILDSKPLTNRARAEAIIQVFAARAMAELERQHATDALHQLNQELEARVEQRTLQLESTVAQLIESEARLQKLAANVPGLLYQFRQYPDGTIAFQYASSGSRDLLELEPEVLLQDAQSVWQRIHPDDIATVESSVLLSAQTLDFWQIEGRWIMPSGQVKWVQGASRPEQLEDGSVLWDGLLIDVTERKRTEAELCRALEREKELNELKSDFVSMVSHEFRTPLSTILCATELLQHYGLQWSEDKKQVRYSRIIDAVKRMSQLLNHVLVISKTEAGRLQFQPGSVNLVEFCQQLFNEVQVQADARHTFTFTPQSCPTWVCLDSQLLRYILSNLLSNAIKYSPQGGPIHLRVTADLEQVWFEVSDRGIGIPAADQVHLFTAFQRGSNVSTISGTGLGLSIVKQCVDLHRGEIAMVSEVGVGTTFTVILPLAIASPVATDETS